ncbi:hypothetical protein N3K66_006712 [Trichothecium roseum]|uniref:Uncharacterized protein n=1 Tax=Trichothecium roseum TaxID=47278 RepID=A0ACC0UXE9_9HYPO|nr:hypothetical protein N3K66_006712 [Trichothecium roseum]
MARPTTISLPRPSLSMLLVATAAILLFLVGPAAALEVTPGSSCASICLDADSGEKDAFDPAASTTNTTDITCLDDSFSSEKGKGKKFHDCLECLQKSKKVDEEQDESDLHWYLYNLRYSLSTCLYSEPNNSPEAHVTPCVLSWACGTLKGALVEDKLNPNGTDTYGYCDADGGLFTKPEGKLDSCITCLRGTSDQTYLANFMVALQAGCQQKPDKGQLLGLTGSPFTVSAINSTSEEDAEDVRSRPGGAGSATLTTGAIVGIAIGAALLLFGALALFFIHWRRQRRLDRDEKAATASSSYRGSQAGTPDPILPPGGTQMSSSLRTYSAQSNYGGGNMSSGDYYDKLEEDIRAGNMGYSLDLRAPSSRAGPGGLPAHQAYVPRAPSKLHASESNAAAAGGPRTLRNSTMPRHSRSHTTGSVPYQRPSDFGARAPSLAAPAPAKTTAAAGGGAFTARTGVPPPPPGPPPRKGHHGKTPSLTLPIAPKLRLPRQYAPPTVTVQDVQPHDDEGDVQRGMQISAPMMGQAGVIGLGLSNHHRPSHQQQQPRGGEHASPGDVSMRSGKSALYGI